MAGDATKDLSGSFLSQERWSASLASLSAPGCTVRTLRLFHNTPEHLIQLLEALAANSASCVERLFIGELCPQGAPHLSMFLQRAGRPGCCPHLNSLELQQLPQAPQAAKEVVDTLAQGLAANSSVVSLTVSSLEDAGAMEALCRALASRAHAPLQRLAFPRCPGPMASGPALAALSAVLAQHTGSLQCLELPECGLGDEEAARLLGSLQMQGQQPLAPALVRVDLSANRVGAATAAALAQLLGCAPALQEALLPSNPRLGDAGAQALADGLAHARSLRQLNLQGCSVGAPGVQALAAGLRSCAPVEVLELGDNAMGTSGLAALLLAMGPGCTCMRLSHLDVRANRIKCGDLGQELQKAQALAPAQGVAAGAEQAAPAVAVPLRSLHISKNWVGDQGLAALLGVLGPCLSMVELDLSEGAIADAGVEALVAFLSEQPQMEVLLLEQNRIQNAGAELLMRACKGHPNVHRLRAEEGNRISDPTVKSRLAELAQVLNGRKYMAEERRRRQQQRQPCCGGDAEDMAVDSSGSDGADDMAATPERSSNGTGVTPGRGVRFARGQAHSDTHRAAVLLSQQPQQPAGQGHKHALDNGSEGGAPAKHHHGSAGDGVGSGGHGHLVSHSSLVNNSAAATYDSWCGLALDVSGRSSLDLAFGFGNNSGIGAGGAGGGGALVAASHLGAWVSTPGLAPVKTAAAQPVLLQQEHEHAAATGGPCVAHPLTIALTAAGCLADSCCGSSVLSLGSSSFASTVGFDSVVSAMSPRSSLSLSPSHSVRVAHQVHQLLLQHQRHDAGAATAAGACSTHAPASPLLRATTPNRAALPCLQPLPPMPGKLPGPAAVSPDRAPQQQQQQQQAPGSGTTHAAPAPLASSGSGITLPPSYRRYSKPLTPEQQRLFDDF